MDRKTQLREIQWKAKCLSRIWAKWLRKNGKAVDLSRREQLESDLASLLRKYQEEWGVNVVGLRIDPVGVSIRRGEATESRCGASSRGGYRARTERPFSS
jgi:hypothetical protein